MTGRRGDWEMGDGRWDDWMTRRLKEMEAWLLNEGFFIVAIHI